jgi:hypothetical protein
MKQVWRLGIVAAVMVLSGCASPPPSPLASEAFVPQPGESAGGFENRCIAYVTDHASYAEAQKCMDQAAAMRLASAPQPRPAVLASAARAPGAVPHAGPVPLAPAGAKVAGAKAAGAKAMGSGAVAADRACGTSIEEASADGGRTVAITVSGTITLGCKQKLDGVVADATRAYPKAQLYFVLNSPGGALQTAVQMGQIVAKDRLPVVVPANAMCASACFLILAASQTKYVSQTAHVGVHSAAEAKPGNETEGSKAVTTDFARILAQLGVPSEIIGRLVETPPGAMYWLTPEELMTMGVRLLPT